MNKLTKQIYKSIQELIDGNAQSLDEFLSEIRKMEEPKGINLRFPTEKMWLHRALEAESRAANVPLGKHIVGILEARALSQPMNATTPGSLGNQTLGLTNV
jgi:hypothetical protein